MAAYFRQFITSAFLILVVATAGFTADSASKNQRIEPSIFGDIVIDHQVIGDLLDAPVMDRLKHVDQSGTPRYFTAHIPTFTRYDHSVGVYALLKKIGAPLNEQIAGLLHDASHTVFSHTGDWVVDKSESEDSYQDDIHFWYMKQMKVGDTLQKYGIKLTDVLAKDNGHTALEQDLPDMCPDRIEYNLHTALIFGLLSKAEVKNIVDDLRFENGKWYFQDPKQAIKFAQLSLYFTQYLWGSPFNQVINYWSGRMLKRSFEIGLCTKDDFNFGKDKDVVSKLVASDDPVIKELIDKCKNYQNHYEVVDMGHFDLETKPKFRGIDPLVQVNGKLVRLTSVDVAYKNEYDRVKTLVRNGIKIRLF